MHYGSSTSLQERIVSSIFQVQAYVRRPQGKDIMIQFVTDEPLS